MAIILAKALSGAFCLLERALLETEAAGASEARRTLHLLLVTKLTILLDTEALLTVMAAAAELVAVKISGDGGCCI